jgi:hypothetical protein
MNYSDLNYLLIQIHQYHNQSLHKKIHEELINKHFR